MGNIPCSLLCKQCLCSHKGSKLRLPALPETAVSACWGSTPNPLNSPVAGAGYAFVPRTLLSLRSRDRRNLRPLAERKTASPLFAAAIEWRPAGEGTVWLIPKSRPDDFVNSQSPPHGRSRFQSLSWRIAPDYCCIAGAR